MCLFAALLVKSVFLNTCCYFSFNLTHDIHPDCSSVVTNSVCPVHAVHHLVDKRYCLLDSRLLIYVFPLLIHVLARLASIMDVQYTNYAVLWGNTTVTRFLHVVVCFPPHLNRCPARWCLPRFLSLSPHVQTIWGSQISSLVSYFPMISSPLLSVSQHWA